MKWIFFFCGIIATVLGTIGIIIPLLPTTPLYLLAAICFMKSSQKTYDLFVRNKLFGRYIRNYIEKREISIRNKIFTLVLLWFSMLYTIVLVEQYWLKSLLGIVLILVTVHIILIRGKK